MFSGTIAENMRNVKQEATDEEIVEALKLACAWEFVEKLPDGIESMIKERGGGFSEGQSGSGAWLIKECSKLFPNAF